jgi:CheY-like chemotaxis protein/anti-sigma regulatory factor (Ser/Thr protein kinase)
MSEACGMDLGPQTSRRRILVADDDEMVRQVLERYLNSQGMEVQAACDGQEALSMFSSQHFDLVISDLRMPGIDGLQLLHAIKGLNPRVPFIFISGYGDIPTVVEALKAGADNFLGKPVEMAELAKVVQQALNLAVPQPLPLLQMARMRQITYLEVPSRSEYIRDLISQIAHSAMCVGYADCDLDNNLKLALVEALTNAMEHGNHWDENRLVRLEVNLTSDCLAVVIEDQGEGFDVGSLPDPTCGDQMFSERGRGVFLMQAIMDEVCYNPQGNQVTMIKHRPPVDPSSPTPA